MQKLLLELGGPLVFAFVLLGLARFVRGIIERFRTPDANEVGEGLDADDGSDDHGADQKSTD
ncbi:MAG: hypothetical protein ABSG69_12660 [Candidatus Acidiferrum sp.]|jgi:hypothetical protein